MAKVAPWLVVASLLLAPGVAMRRQISVHNVKKSQGVCKKTAEQCAESVNAFDNMFENATQPLEAELQAAINAALASSSSDRDSEAAIFAPLEAELQAELDAALASSSSDRDRDAAILALSNRTSVASLMLATHGISQRSQLWGSSFKHFFGNMWTANWNYCDAESDGEDECDKEEGIKNYIKKNVVQHMRWVVAGSLKSTLDYIEGNEAARTTNRMHQFLADVPEADWYTHVVTAIAPQLHREVDQRKLAEMLTPEKWISLGKVLSPILTEYTDKAATVADTWAESGCLQYYFEEHLKVTCSGPRSTWQ